MNKKLRLFRLTGLLDNLDLTLEKLISLKCVYPIKASEFKQLTHGLSPISTDNSWNIIYQEIKELELESKIDIPVIDKHTIDYSFKDIQMYVHNTHAKLHTLIQHQKITERLINQYKDALIQINNIIDLDISLDDIFSCHYVSARFGKLPIDSLDILKLYDNKPIVFQLFKQEKNYYWCMYLTTQKNEKEIDNIFSSLYFNRVYIPDFIHGTPESARKTLGMEIKVAEENLKEIKQEVKNAFEANMEELIKTKSELIFLEKLFEARKYVISLGDKFNISGFILLKNVEYLKSVFKNVKNVEIEIMPADFDKRLKPPKQWKRLLKKPCFKS